MSAAVPTLLGDIDTARPIRAHGGEISLRGWCVFAGSPIPPPMRLAGDGFALPQTSRETRLDVSRQCPQEPAASESGFVIDGRLPRGVHLARVEARRPDGAWQALRTLCVAVEAAPFLSGIDAPVNENPVTRRDYVEGWALHPAGEIVALNLRYGHQEIACDIGRSRADLANTHPDLLHAARTGFKSRVILSAGIGPLRLKAKLANGAVALTRTALDIVIPTDENVGPEIDLASPRLPLPAVTSREDPSPLAPSGRTLNILFVLYGSFTSNSALHVAALANELAGMGHACQVSVAHEAETISRLRAPRFTGLTHADALGDLHLPDGRGVDVIHAWTTRENVRSLALALRARSEAKLVVHLEDNEQQILAQHLGRDPATFTSAELDRLVPPDLANPQRSRDFLESADGVTVITDSLRELLPSTRPCLTLLPAADTRYFYPQPLPEAFRRLLQRAPDETFLFYHGNVHATNAAEMRELYAALLQLNEAGERVTLIRTGRDTVDFLGELAPRVAPHVVALGEVRHHHHPPLMALADFFVQPGRDDAFNRYRLPSKLPEFFALGRPVILPRTNVGTVARHGVDAYVLEDADASHIAAAIRHLRGDPALRARLAAGAVAFAEKHFSWRRSAGALANFYASLTA